MSEQPSLFDYDPHKHARNSDPDTSHQAAAQFTNLNGHCAALLRAYAGAEAGLTAEEAGAIAGLDYYASSRRTSDLMRMGYIEPLVCEGKPVTRLNASNRLARVCTATAAGRNTLGGMA